MSEIENLKYDGDGLIPAVIQDAGNGDVLMVGYMNREAVERTVKTGRVTYWSRSRHKYWVKGETSGHVQRLKGLYFDCDKDCLLVEVEQEGPACHEGYRSCFFRKLTPDARGFEVIGERLKTPEEIYGP